MAVLEQPHAPVAHEEAPALLSNRRGRTLPPIACGALLALLAAAPLAAQDSGTVAGTVVDASGQVVPGATVTLTNEATVDARTMPSNERGEFAFRAVPPGSYTVRIELAGFRAIDQRHNIVNASSQINLGRLVLEIGALNEVVTVQSAGTFVETTNSDYSSLLTEKQLAQIQTRGRDVMSLLKLLPGVRAENDIDAMGDSFGSNVPNINGMRRAWNQVTVDGLNGNELSGTSRFSSAINLDAIAEVKVLLNTYKAEFGRTGGANIEIVSKSGSMDYKGGAYWYGRRDAWNANTWENNRAGTPKGRLHIDTYGFNLGGPVKIPGLFNTAEASKLFFFYSLEAPQVQRPGPQRLFRVPSELERQGNFSQSIDTTGRAVTVVDPVTRQPFPGNIIPANRIDPSMQKLLTCCRCRTDRTAASPTTSPGRKRLRIPAGTTCCGSTTATRAATASGASSAPSTRTSTARRSPRRRRAGASSTRPTSSPTAR